VDHGSPASGREPQDIAALASEVERLRAELHVKDEEIQAIRARNAETAEILRAQIERATADADEHRRRLQQIYTTRTWKLGWIAIALGRALRNPLWAIRRVLGRRPQGTRPDTPADRARRMPAAVADFRLAEDDALRESYGRALAKGAFSGDQNRIAMAVSTTDLSEGRGDVYTAVGLGRYLERMGYEVVYLPRERWYSPPEGTDVYLGLLDEVDLFRVPPAPARVAWVRNRTAEWVASRSLALYDAVLCSSELSLAEVRRAYAGPAGLLRIGVDHELFRASGAGPTVRAGVATTVNGWGRERELFHALRRIRIDFPLAIYGQQRGLSEDLHPCWVGPASFFGLPSVYREAVLVLDDMNHTTKPYGNVNSRVYEALACGAPVVTNSRVGLAETGLAALPVYGSPEELDAAIHGVLADPDAALARAAELREVVLRDHTFERRAQQLDAFLRGLEPRRRSGPAVIAYSPDYVRGNPYQRLLYSSAARQGIATVPVAGPGDVLGTRLVDLGPRLVYHLHWTATILGPAPTERDARRRARAFLGELDELRSRGARFVWTVHNVLPHECRFPVVEAELRQELADRADLVCVMCEETADATAAYYTLPRERMVVVPHPGYVGAYPNVIDEARARSELGLRPDDMVFCFFGGIRPYKGIDVLLDAFEEVAAVNPDARLIVVGPAGRFAELPVFEERCRADPRIIANFNRIADRDVQVFLNAADVMVFPHRAVLNSGSVMLAYSFGRPVIAPAVGCVADVLTPDASITFDPTRAGALREAMLAAEDLQSPRARRAALEKAAAFPAQEISERFLAALRQPPRGDERPEPRAAGIA
jgi:glycosyltransferase involved in cell wall biosynthesis